MLPFRNPEKTRPSLSVFYRQKLKHIGNTGISKTNLNGKTSFPFGKSLLTSFLMLESNYAVTTLLSTTSFSHSPSITVFVNA